ncbi:MAG: hypothetical protein PHQ74_08900 [Crocinitomicaceae bacterium]|nr:hypothetical protein [Crocinitomicaceae bacterium]
MSDPESASHFSKQESELMNQILRLTEDIRTKHPEIAHFLAELPETIPNQNHPHVQLEELEKHHETLNKILQRYLREKKN